MSNLLELDDDSLMPWGKHKGDKMKNVPDAYLKYMYDSGKVDARVKAYIEEYLNYTE
jgi:uncharacterized protein (DUF3820 family)